MTHRTRGQTFYVFGFPRYERRMFVFLFVGIIVVVLLALLFVIGLRASKLMEEIEPLEQRSKALQTENGQLRAHIVALDVEDKKKAGWLDGMEEELVWLRSALDKRPKIERKVYRILTVGVKATGKTSLTLKWSNPIIERILPKNAYDHQLLQRMKAERRMRPPMQNAVPAGHGVSGAFSGAPLGAHSGVQAGSAGRGTLPTTVPVAMVLAEKPIVQADPPEFGNTAPLLRQPVTPYGRG